VDRQEEEIQKLEKNKHHFVHMQQNDLI